jgi:large subunit ribosomal protein L3
MANSMMGLLGRKIGMTQIFDEAGTVMPVTVIEAGPNKVLRVKLASSSDGYSALQLGFGTQKTQRLNKADLGQLKKAGVEGGIRTIREIRVTDAEAAKHQVGASLNVTDVFTEGTRVDVIGTSKGKGFGGVMKKYNFAGFERSHGVHEFFRHGGSIGTRLTPGMTFKGKKMPGHMGSVKKSIQNLKIVRVDAERNLLFVLGGVPGATGGMVTVRHAVKLLNAKK